MQIKEQPIPYQLLYRITDRYVKEEIIFFDIETTGFSAATSYVYLIGCAYYQDGSYQLIQWLSDKIEEESELLTRFFTFVQKYKLLVHYNGTAFDLPFLLTRCQKLKLPYNFDAIDSLDIYKQIIPYKKNLPLNNLKLKTVEHFLDISRKDQLDGATLIKIYTKYVALHALHRLCTTESIHVSKESGLPTIGEDHPEELLSLLLLHNAEDVMNLLPVCSMLVYSELFSMSAEFINATDCGNGIELILWLQLPLTSPIRWSFPASEDPAYHVVIQACEQEVKIQIPIYQGTLKFFFDNYKDYYYLPVEDIAVHKSVGEYVDKEFRQNARPNTCYTKKEGRFLPQKLKLITPCFYFDYKDKISWFELTPNFLNDRELIKIYLSSLS